MSWAVEKTASFISSGIVELYPQTNRLVSDLRTELLPGLRPGQRVVLQSLADRDEFSAPGVFVGRPDCPLLPPRKGVIPASVDQRHVPGEVIAHAVCLEPGLFRVTGPAWQPTPGHVQELRRVKVEGRP